MALYCLSLSPGLLPLADGAVPTGIVGKEVWGGAAGDCDFQNRREKTQGIS